VCGAAKVSQDGHGDQIDRKPAGAHDRGVDWPFHHGRGRLRAAWCL
jgi:hypothetical protein